MVFNILANWFLKRDQTAIEEIQYVIPAKETAPARSLPFLQVKDIREDAPKFAREYGVAIPGGFRCCLRAKSYTYSGRSYFGELTQPNGRWILFDPERVADKIIDRDLVDYVTGFCTEAIKIDREFLASNPSQYVDERGRVWSISS